MNFQPFDLAALPKRERGPQVDPKAARALLAIIEKNGAATDGQKYDTAVKARTAATKATRMLNTVLPEGSKGSVRTFALDGGGFGYTVFVKSDEDEQPADDAAE